MLADALVGPPIVLVVVANDELSFRLGQIDSDNDLACRVRLFMKPVIHQFIGSSIAISMSCFPRLGNREFEIAMVHGVGQCLFQCHGGVPDSGRVAQFQRVH